MRSSIRRRLTITFVCIAILPLLVAGIAVACQSFTVQRQQVLALQSEVAQRIAVEASGYVDQVENELRQVVALHELAKHRPSAQRNLLSELQAYRQGYASLTLLDEVGRELIRVERLHVVPQDELRSRASEDAFRRPTETDRTYISPITFDQLTGEPALTVAVPIPDPRTGQNSRVLVAQVRVKKIWDLLRDVPVRGGETIYIVDSERRVVAHRQPSIVLRDTRVQLSGKDGFARGLDGGLVVQSVHPFTLGEQQLTVVVERPVGEAFRLLIGTAATTAVALLVTLGVSLGLGLVAVRQIVRPVESLAEVARAITAGDHSRRARVDTGDEIEHLADAFNTMNEQLRHTLESLHTVVANVPMFLYTADAGGRVTFIEGRALESLRQTPAEIIGHTLTALDPDSAELRQVAGAGLAGERLNGTVEIRGLTFELRSTPLLDHAGQVSGSIGVGIDITNRQILEAQLRHAQKLEAVGTLANGIAHDFNNVLAAIQGFAELAILDVPPDEPLHEDLRQITLAAQRGGALTRQLLTFSRPHATERQPTNLALLAGEVTKMLRPVITR
ncbi:MAG: hypothetical protein RLZZ387_2764, partial [Chloroflexota bacterium]